MDIASNTKNLTYRLFSLITICTLLTACGGGGGGGESTTTEATAAPETTVSVTANADGSHTITANLNWNIPIVRENGDTLAVGELSGYVIRYSLKGSTDYLFYEIDKPETDAITFYNLTPGIYEFSIASIAASGLQSEYSDIYSIEITNA